VMGVHYPSDVEGGRVAGTLIAAKLVGDPAFRAGLGAVRAELRKALALPLQETATEVAH